MPTDQSPKQLIVERIKNASNILVTVSRNPGVDELSAALGLTLMLDKLDKNPTAVFSGKIPPAIDFLEPGKTFEENVDSLRDFIIALDKEKADRLRYKVEDDVVRVFITPYKTTITEKDLTFSQGDFNVDLVIALGVDKREDLDAAITAHGRILHDSVVVTINQLPSQASLGEVDWSQPDASSLCEMLMSLSEALQAGLLDQQIATAILTGLVSSTDRFRNSKTTPKVMTMAAQLMAAGANQQLIAEKLEEASTVTIDDLQTVAPVATEVTPAQKVDGEMKVEHEEAAPSETTVVAAQTPGEKAGVDAIKEAEDELAAALAKTTPAAAVVPDIPVTEDEPETTLISRSKISSWRDIPAPLTGGTLNATTDEAEDDTRREEEDNKNHVILSHDAEQQVSSGAGESAAINATMLNDTEPKVQDIFATAPSNDEQTPILSKPESVIQPLPPTPLPADATPPTETPSGISFEETPVTEEDKPLPPDPKLSDIEAEVHRQAEAMGGSSNLVDVARSAVDAALGAQPFNPSGTPLASSGAQPLGDISHDDVSVPAIPPAPLPAPPPLPPLPDFSTLPPLPGEVPLTPTTPSVVPSFGLPEQTAAQPQVPQANSDPGQFQIPNQS